MRIFILFISISIIWTSCKPKHEGFVESDNNFYYKFNQIGDGEKKPNFGDYIVVDISYKTSNDSIFFKGRRKFKLTQPLFKGDISYCFEILNQGDSADFIINANDFFTKTINSKLPSFFNKNSDMIVSAKMLEIIDSVTYNKQKAEFLSWVEDFGEYEKILLNHYIKGQEISVSPSVTGLYKITQKPGNNINVERGDTVVVHYEGMFLSGKYFDSTKKRNSPFEFVYGTEWQVVKGVEEAIGRMTEGEKAMFIMPSELAFGNSGSSTGIIPPFTPVIYKIELLQVRKGISN